jgi:hypothetical protein
VKPYKYPKICKECGVRFFANNPIIAFCEVHRRSNKKGVNYGILSLLLFLVIIFIVGMVYIVLSAHEESARVLNVSANISYQDVFLRTNALSALNFSINFTNVNMTNNDTAGVLMPGVTEQLSHVQSNNSFIFSAWGGDYYYNNVMCVANQTYCLLNLSRKALGYNVSVNQSEVTIFNVDGLLKNASLCWMYHRNLMDVRMNLSILFDGEPRAGLVDYCFVLGDLNESKSYPVLFVPNPYYNSSEEARVFVVDHEVLNHTGVVVRSASVTFI